MSVRGAVYRKVLASFLLEIAHQGGWWYRIPKMSTKVPHQVKAFLPDKIMPHFGRVFGLTEDAAALLLERMELVSINSTTNLTRVLSKGFYLTSQHAALHHFTLCRTLSFLMLLLISVEGITHTRGLL